MAQHKPLYRSSWAQTVPTRVRRRHPVRRLLGTLVLLAAILGAAYAYVLHVYAPGLRAEAGTIPARVHAQLNDQGAPYAPLDSMSPLLRQAIVSIEDRRFYSHPGIDPLGIARALWVNLTSQHIDQGGSTLEEQLVKRSLVPDDRTLRAKVRTMALAWVVDQQFSKSQVLELYLNAAYYGQGAYGAAAAARTYFGVDIGSLTLPQAAFLAALPQAPTLYGSHPTAPAILARKNTVLQDMQAQGYISAAQESAAEQAPLRFAFPNP